MKAVEVGRRIFAEALGAMLLAGVVIGSGIMASGLAQGNDGVALLANTAATAAILFVLIAALGPVSGAHFNPAVTLVIALRREIGVGLALAYVPVQAAGCIAGAVLAHAMFALPLLQTATHARAGGAQILSETVATFALVLAIVGVSRWRPQAVAAAVALVIAAGYWWTASTSFANPAITIARAMSDTFAGIRPADAPGFVAGQILGALAAAAVCAFLFPIRGASAEQQRSFSA
jgi:glycerol uptake facilitator-like aquaporin